MGLGFGLVKNGGDARSPSLLEGPGGGHHEVDGVDHDPDHRGKGNTQAHNFRPFGVDVILSKSHGAVAIDVVDKDSLKK